MRSRGRPKTEGILTPRELEVLELIRTGRSNREIAEVAFGVSIDHRGYRWLKEELARARPSAVDRRLPREPYR